MDALEYAYRWTNNVNGSWSRGKQLSDGEENGDYNGFVTVVEPLEKDASGKEWGHRSTSMGDHMIHKGTEYKVSMVGFTVA